MSRFKASAIHLLLSAAIICTALLLMITIWYPGALFYAAGGQRLMLILACVDVIIGPLITLIIFDTKKKSLKFDLAVIAMLQSAALIYGGLTIFDARPVFVVFAKDRFELVRANDINPDNLANAVDPQFRELPIGGPIWVGTVLPTDMAERMRLFDSALQGADVQVYPRYYVPMSRSLIAIAANARPVGKLLESGDPTAKMVKASLESNGTDPRQVGYLPLNARSESLTVLVSKRDGKVLDTLRLDPW